MKFCVKIIERDFFPSCFRAGFQAERPDSNLFLEQWIPFDITNMSCEDDQHLEDTIDFRMVDLVIGEEQLKSG